MRAVLLHEAEMEFWASVDYYDEQEPGLGVRFKLEVDQFIAKIETEPMQPRLRWFQRLRLGPPLLTFPSDGIRMSFSGPCCDDLKAALTAGEDRALKP